MSSSVIARPSSCADHSLDGKKLELQVGVNKQLSPSGRLESTLLS
jgi:hypothetical protein